MLRKEVSNVFTAAQGNRRETGRSAQLKWIDIDFERRLITVTPEKGSNPRLLRISEKLVTMLKALPKKKDQVFSSLHTLQTCFWRKKRNLASKTNNPRLLKIHFHTFRHWKATMEYHKTKDPWHVKKILGHKSLHSTEIYINIEQAIFETESDEFHVKVTEKPEEIKTLLETGFEYICQKDQLMFFRKRK
ncbi:MAG: site-specific integrase [Candidatus Bathyarchaeota archaeon]|nr:site-specific integrase [Candidatus Bathyarchaeota archaeon]